MCWIDSKFHSMQAHVSTDSDTGAIRFYSYDTLICEVSGDLIVVGNYFRCSPTTRKQFSRFLSENNLPPYLTLKSLEEGMLKESGTYTGEVFQAGDYHVTFSNAPRFFRQFNSWDLL